MSDHEIWQPLSLERLSSLFRNAAKTYWVSGGWAIDLFLGQQMRPHDDLDVSIARDDQFYFQDFLKGWDLQVVDPPNSKTLRHWRSQEKLQHPTYNIWSREVIGGPWNIQFMLCDFENSEWVYRRNKTIRGPQSEFSWVTDQGINVLSPVIQLLYKSRNPREKDVQDLRACLPKISKSQAARLRQLILADAGADHAWLKLI